MRLAIKARRRAGGRCAAAGATLLAGCVLTACGSSNGPNFNIRKETPEQVLYAIRNGGFSGAIMPQNVVVGQDAQAVANFLAQYSGRDKQSGSSASVRGLSASARRDR